MRFSEVFVADLGGAVLAVTSPDRCLLAVEVDEVFLDEQLLLGRRIGNQLATATSPG
jgi:hypothetical protein